jgi:hypothetical protein
MRDAHFWWKLLFIVQIDDGLDSILAAEPGFRKGWLSWILV